MPELTQHDEILYVYQSSKLLETIAEDFRKEIVQILKVMVRFAFDLKSMVRKHPARDPTVKD